MSDSNETHEKKKKTKRARLGRGLGALIDQGSSAQVNIDLQTPQERNSEQNTNEYTNPHGLDADASLERVLELDVHDIVANPHQPRRSFDEDAIASLAESISTHGLMQPIVVRLAKDRQGYELVAGERRLRATKKAGLGTIRAVFSDADDERSAQLALVENIQRADLNPIERAMGFAQLMDRFGFTQQQLADRMGMSRPAVANTMRLLELDSDVRELVSSGALSLGHGKVLLSCDDAQRRHALALQCVAEQWTVRLLETKIAREQSSQREVSPAGGATADAHSSVKHDRLASVLQDLERRLSEQLGTRVSVSTNSKGSKGRIIVEFYDLDQFDGLLERFGVSNESDTI